MKFSVITSRGYLVASVLLVSLVGFVNTVLAQSDLFPGADDDRLAATFSNLGQGAEVGAVLVNLVTTIVVSAAFLFFFWNLVVYIRSSGDEQKEQAKSRMIWSVLAMVVITSLWGIIGYVRSVAGVGTGEDARGPVTIPGTYFLDQDGNIKLRE